MENVIRYIHHIPVPECENPIHYGWVILATITEGWNTILSQRGVQLYYTGIDAGTEYDKRYRVFVCTDTDITEWISELEYPPHFEEETD